MASSSTTRNGVLSKGSNKGENPLAVNSAPGYTRSSRVDAPAEAGQSVNYIATTIKAPPRVTPVASPAPARLPGGGGGGGVGGGAGVGRAQVTHEVVPISESEAEGEQSDGYEEEEGVGENQVRADPLALPEQSAGSGNDPGPIRDAFRPARASNASSGGLGKKRGSAAFVSGEAAGSDGRTSRKARALVSKRSARAASPTAGVVTRRYARRVASPQKAVKPLLVQRSARLTNGWTVYLKATNWNDGDKRLDGFINSYKDWWKMNEYVSIIVKDPEGRKEDVFVTDGNAFINLFEDREFVLEQMLVLLTDLSDRWNAMYSDSRTVGRRIETDERLVGSTKCE